MTENYVKMELPVKESKLAYIMWENMKDMKNLDDFQKFHFIFAYFYNLGKYNNDPINPQIKTMIDDAVKKGILE